MLATGGEQASGVAPRGVRCSGPYTAPVGRSAGCPLLGLVLAKDHHRQPNLDFIPVFKQVLADALPVDKGAIDAVLILQAIGPRRSIMRDDGVDSGCGGVVEDQVALAAAANGQAVVADLDGTLSLLALAKDEHAQPLRTGVWLWVWMWACTACLVVVTPDTRRLCPACCLGLTVVAT
jgi:hypothetical protein